MTAVYAPEGNTTEDRTTELAARVLVWILLGAILLILLVAVATVAKSLLAVVAGATTLVALAALGAAVILALRVVRLEERVKQLEQR